MQELGEMQRASANNTMKHRQVSSEVSLQTGRRRYTESQYRYLINTRHYGDDENVVWDTVKVLRMGIM